MKPRDCAIELLLGRRRARDSKANLTQLFAITMIVLVLMLLLSWG